MDLFSYVMVLASVIGGLAIAHLLQGIARIVQHPGRAKIYWVHLTWVAFAFEYVVLWWWFEFQFSTVTTWTFPLYAFILLYAVLLYLLCALLFPIDLEGYDGFEDYFYSRRKWFFNLAIVIYLVDLLDTVSKGWAHFWSLGWHYPLSELLTPILFLIAIWTANRRYHATLAVLVLIDQSAFAFVSYGIMQ